MKKRITGCLVTTALAVVVLSFIASLYGGHFICVDTIYQIAVVNIVIHIALFFFEKLECNYSALEIMGELGIVLASVLVGGFLFNWFSSVPVILLGIMGIVIYLFAWLIEAVHLQNDVKQINALLERMSKKGDQL